MTRYAVAPAPPAGPGDQPDAGAIDDYVSELGRWRVRREHELRALDELTRVHERRDELADDVTTAMTLYHAIAQRHDLLMAAWGEGEHGRDERGWVSQLVWGVLELPDGDAHALALPLPDALRLCDAMAGALRAQIGADEDGMPWRRRVDALASEVDRVRKQLVTEGRDGQLSARLDEVGQAVAGLRERPEEDAALDEPGRAASVLATVERELLVARASEAHGRVDREQAVAELVARGEAVRNLAQQALDTINPAPRLGIPDVEALGEVPEDEAGLATYSTNLERVGRALEQAHSTYAAALAEFADLADRAERLARTLAGCGAPTSVDLAGMLTAAKESLHTRPADVRRAAALIAAQEAYLDQLRTEG